MESWNLTWKHGGTDGNMEGRAGLARRGAKPPLGCREGPAGWPEPLGFESRSGAWGGSSRCRRGSGLGEVGCSTRKPRDEAQSISPVEQSRDKPLDQEQPASQLKATGASQSINQANHWQSIKPSNQSRQNQSIKPSNQLRQQSDRPFKPEGSSCCGPRFKLDSRACRFPVPRMSAACQQASHEPCPRTARNSALLLPAATQTLSDLLDRCCAEPT